MSKISGIYFFFVSCFFASTCYGQEWTKIRSNENIPTEGKNIVLYWRDHTYAIKNIQITDAFVNGHITYFDLSKSHVKIYVDSAFALDHNYRAGKFSIPLGVIKSAYVRNETEPGTLSFWFNTGLGASSVGRWAANIGGNIQYGAVLLSVRATLNNENKILEGEDQFTDLGLLVGIASKNTKTFASITAGIAVVTWRKFVGSAGLLGDGKHVGQTPVFGFPIEAQFFLKLRKDLGIGITSFYDINSIKSFGGLALNLQIGRLY